MDDLNYLGATIFWLYILAALFLSSVVIYTIVTIDTPGQLKEGQNGDVRLFSILAATSFVALSINMLNVLVKSYQSWSVNLKLANSLDVRQIWRWSFTSTLFQDFGEAIVADTPRYLWAQTALLATLSVCLFMGIEGRRRQVPRLWAFFFLSQILPISFTQNLFYIALAKLPDRQSRATTPSTQVIGLVATYCSCLFTAPLSRNATALISVIILARLILFLPLVSLDPDFGDRHERRPSWEPQLTGQQMHGMVATAALACTVNQLCPLVNGQLSVRDISNALFDHPAVSALGCDFLLCVVSFAVWTWRSRSTASVYEKTS